MISLRQHAISLIAVFLALAVGVALGSGFVADRVRDDDSTSADGGRADDVRDQVNGVESFNTAIAPRLLRGLLADRSVVLVTAPGAADADVAAVKQVLNQAGAQFAGQLGLTDQLVDDSAAQKLTSIVDQSIPSGSMLRPELTDSGGRVGDLLGALLQRKQDNAPASSGDVTAGLQALRQAGFVTYVDGAVRSGQLAVTITGGDLGSNAGARGQLIARFASAFGARGSGAVLTGRTGSAQGGSPIAVLRSDPALARTVSSVDDVETSTGRLTTALALAGAAQGKPGAYGDGAGATAVAPTLTN